MKNSPKRKQKNIFISIIVCLVCVCSFHFAIYAEENEETIEDNSTQEDITGENSEKEEEISNIDEEPINQNVSEEISVNTVEEASLYTIDAIFDGTSICDENLLDTTFTWNNTNAKDLAISLKRNTNVTMDTDKKYIVSVKVSELFYFSGLPVAEDINGVEEIAFMKNKAPKVNNEAGSYLDLPTFSPYSGEIRFVLNPSVDIITIPNIGINYNKELVGYTGTSQIITSPLEVSFFSVSNEKNIQEIIDEDKNNLSKYEVNAIQITTSSVSGSGMKNIISIDGFNSSSINMQDAYIEKDSDTVSFSGGTAGQLIQYYKSLVVEFSCPYIEINGKKYYLSFDKQDRALIENSQGVKKGFKMSQEAIYDETKHSITYSFEDIYCGGHGNLFYTPKFSWPNEEEVKDYILQSGENFIIQGASWTVLEQIGYTGANGSLRKEFIPTYHAYFYPNEVDIRLMSSLEAPKEEKIAKREIYNALTRANGIEGTLGFFDIHNDGTKDSPKVKISFDFNTEGSDEAKYYVTKVNLPVSLNTNGVDVSYSLTNGTDVVSGIKHYSKNSDISCLVSDLRKESSISEDYYIQSLSYETFLKHGTSYHMETAHLWRNRVTDSGLFFGYIEGNTGTTAHASMKIEAIDETQAINRNGDSKLESVEKSTIADSNYIAFSLPEMKIEDGSSTAITAGESFTLSFGALVNSEEYPLVKTGEYLKVNGYHVFENGLFYLCLPKGVSILGNDQVDVRSFGKKIAVQSVKMIGETCTVNEQEAQWWEIEADNIRQTASTAFSVKVQLATDLEMNSLSWNFQNCVAVRAKGQSVSWGAAGLNAVYNTVAEINRSNTSSSIQALTSYFTSQNDTEKLGIGIYNNTNTKLTIARAEAKLDITPSLNIDSDTSDNTEVSISNKDSIINYDLFISSGDGGYAENFEYYIPVVSKEYAIDSNALVSKKEFSLSLNSPLSIEKNGTILNEEEYPFEVFYTTETNLTSNTIRKDTVTWLSKEDLNQNMDSIRAIKILTKKDTFIQNGEQYVFHLKLNYSGTEEEFNQDAARKVEWRSFGYYTYVRNGATTTETYPSLQNRITICYKKDLTDQPMSVLLRTDSSSNVVNAELNLNETFHLDQTFVVKKVKTNGIQLVKFDPINLNGTNANNQFNVTFNMNNILGNASQLSDKGTDAGRNWVIEKDSKIKLQTEVKFSQALTDQITPKYIDVTIGNDSIDIVFRIQLNRIVKPATADGSGVTSGEYFQVPQVSNQCSIANKSAFTALYVLDFVPGNYNKQTIELVNKDSGIKEFPINTRIIMMEISEDSTVSSYWYYETNNKEESIDLHSFKRMSGNEFYSYDVSTALSRNIKYMFVVDFKDASCKLDTYSFIWNAIAKDSNLQNLSYSYDVIVSNEKTYSLSSNAIEDLIPKVELNYTIGNAENDSFITYKSLALVLEANEDTVLPKDARIKCDDKEFYMNSEGNYIIPIDNITSGSKELYLESDVFPNEKIEYKFNAKLYLSDSLKNSSPLNGTLVSDIEEIVFQKQVKNAPSLCVTGERIGTLREWSAGLPLQIEMKNIGNGKLRVSAFAGLNSTQQVTNLLSSVSGLFDIQSGIGIYNSSNSNTNLLKLSTNIKQGTYRLLFEVLDEENNTILQVPYYIIVKE